MGSEEIRNHRGSRIEDRGLRIDPRLIDPRPATGDRITATIRDRIFIMNTVLLVLTGAVILYRSIGIGLTPLALIIGGGFVAFGVYRLRWIWKYYARRS